MLVFFDESGEPGLKVSQGSTPYFVVVLVIFEDNEEAEAANTRINLLRRELGLSPLHEFHFNKCNEHIRESFLRAITPYDFFYFGIAINKAKLYGEGFKYRESFYKYASSLVFQNAKPYLDNATVVLDGNGSREFRRQLTSYLKRRINEKGATFIKKVKIQGSSGNNLLQLADMIAGAIYRSFTSKPDAATYRQLVKHREIYVQLWPK